MLLLVIFILTVLALANYRIGQKGLFYPPTVFCAVWASDLMLVWMAGDFFYSISTETLFLVLFGCLAFSIGSWITFFHSAPKPRTYTVLSRSSSQFVSLLVMLIVLAVPFCYRWIVGFSSQYDGNLFLAARRAFLDPGNEINVGSTLFSNVVVLAMTVAMIAFFERDHGKKRSFFAVIAAVVLNLLTGGRSGIVQLVLSLVCLDWLRTRRIHWKPVAAMALIFVVTFSVIAIYLQKGDVRTDASLAENIAPIGRGFVLYAASGPVALDRVVREPHIVPHNWHANRFFLETLNKFGARFDIPSLQAEYVTVGPNSALQNIYTFYFAYFDFGYLGMIGITFALGFLTTLCYNTAISGGNIAALVYSAIFAGLVLTIFNENLLLNLNFLVKLVAMAWLVYSLPGICSKFSQITRRLVTIDVATHRYWRRNECIRLTGE